MDVFYYWKDCAADMKAHRIGRFRSSQERLAELQAGYPDYVWVFKTPKGHRGQVQLLARLVWSDTPPSGFKPASGESHIYYDASHRQSVWFDGSEDEAAVEGVSDWVARHFPSAVSSNFQGANGQRAMRGNVLAELDTLSRRWSRRQFNLALPTTADKPPA